MGACFRIGVSAADPQLRNTDSGSSERCPLVFPTGESMAMVHYRIYELDSVDQILDEYSVVCRSDVAATVAVCQLEERAAAVEVWARAHCIARLTAAEAAVPKACSLNASGPVGAP
jgi:hypothetical protein